MDTKNCKSRAQLSSFINYCVTHPEERFWQALRNWSGYHIIGTLQLGVNSGQWLDTFNWEGKRHDETT